MNEELYLKDPTTKLEEIAEGLLQFHNAGEEIFRIDVEGRFFWRGVEVKTTQETRLALQELSAILVTRSTL